MKDLVLLNKLKSENQKDRLAAFNFLYEKCYPIVKSYHKPNDVSNAEDVFQEGVSIAYVNLIEGKFQGNSSFTTYLIGICKNLIASERRRNKMIFEDVSEDTPEISEEEIVENIKVNAALQLISEECKKLLKLYFYENIGFSGLAQQFKLSSEQAVRNKKYRCLKNLMGKIQEKGLNYDSFLK